MPRYIAAAITALILAPTVSAQVSNGVIEPVVAEIFVDEPFRGTEGITFNNEGRMFVAETVPYGKLHRMELRAN